MLQCGGGKVAVLGVQRGLSHSTPNPGTMGLAADLAASHPLH